METIEKIDVAAMKADIKTMVEKQKFYKNQRRTEKLVGDRKMPAWEATYKHQTNREECAGGPTHKHCAAARTGIILVRAACLVGCLSEWS